MNTDERLVWLDLETTGLNPREGCILEVGCVITTNNLVEVDYFESLVTFRDSGEKNTRESCEGFTGKYVLEMHDANGLWDALAVAYGPPYNAHNSDRSLNEVNLRLQSFIKGHTPGLKRLDKHPLCGSTISFDRAWLAEHMPEVEDAVHYRNIDVSTLMGLCQRWRPDLELPPKGGAHRALADIRDSIRFLKFYREHFIRGTVENMSSQF